MYAFLRILRQIFFRPKDPFAKSNFDFLNYSHDDFLFALVQRRQVFDDRLKTENLNKWPIFQFWESIEGLMLSAAEANARLVSGMLSSSELSRRIDLVIDVKGSTTTGALNFKEYLRLVVLSRDPFFSELGSAFLDRHAELCQAYANNKYNEIGGWPPAEWLVKQISIDDTSEAAAISKLVPLMLPGDELWTYFSPPESWKLMMGTAGIVLVRDSRIISEVETMCN
jgi:hypothetical protein